MVAGALVGMALMQFIVSCTLSMLLRHVKRSAVLGKFLGIPFGRNNMSEQKNNNNKLPTVKTDDKLYPVQVYSTQTFR